jgi:hypothetical protein
MEYLFEIVGVSSILSFFDHQAIAQQKSNPGPEYLGTYRCTLDAFIDSVEDLPKRRNWNGDRVVESVIHFWYHNAEAIAYWKSRLEDAGKETLLVARVGDIDALKTEFETLLRVT